MKHITKEVQIACVAITGIVILFFGLQFLKGLSIFTSEHTYYVEFEDISGLTTSAPVYANGYQIGGVKAIAFNYGSEESIVAAISVDKNMRIPKGTKAKIDSDMLGNIKVNLVLGDDRTTLVSPGDTLSGSKDAGTLDKVGAMVPTIEKMLPKLDSIMGSLNALLADPALSNSLHNVETLTGDLTRTTKELNTLMGTLNKDMPTLMKHTTSTMANADKMSSNLADVDFASTISKVDATLANVEAITESLNNKRGTLGLMIHDPGLYNNLNATMSSADSLLRDLKSHPKRYVHFSLFGKKDK